MSPHGKEQLVCPTCCPITFPYFNLRSRTGNDTPDFMDIPEGSQVSIHVPARGTTKEHVPAGGRVRVSIHVPARGTTVPCTALANVSFPFQSTFPHGERLTNSPRSDGLVSFNPRSRTGNDGRKRIRDGDAGKFQSTFPHGERRRIGRRTCLRRCFNPRSRTGNDWDGYKEKNNKIVSIHVPARGTT